MKARLILEIEDRMARLMTGEAWEDLRYRLQSEASDVLCDYSNFGNSGDVGLVLDGPVA